VPIVRTFITVVAGISRMDRRRFLTWSAVGAALWTVSLTLLGYFLGQAFPVLQDKLDVAVVLIVLVSLVPAGIEWYRHRGDVKDATQVAEALTRDADVATDVDETTERR
jgi:membrane-associated protein